MPKAVSLLKTCCGEISISSFWETLPAYTSGPNFVNAAGQIQTFLAAPELKSQVLRQIEAAMGRVRTQDKNAPRPIDLDILIYDDEILDPRIWYEVYLAVPLAELLPDLPNPDTGETLRSVAARLERQAPVKSRLDIRI